MWGNVVGEVMWCECECVCVMVWWGSVAADLYSVSVMVTIIDVAQVDPRRLLDKWRIRSTAHPPTTTLEY